MDGGDLIPNCRGEAPWWRRFRAETRQLILRHSDVADSQSGLCSNLTNPPRVQQNDLRTDAFRRPAGPDLGLPDLHPTNRRLEPLIGN